MENLSVQEAKQLLSKKKLQLEIQDTTYDSRFELGKIIVQNPVLGFKVKENRRVYVSINAFTVPMNTIKDISGFQGDLSNVMSNILEANLKVGKKNFRCGAFKANGYVEFVSYKGKKLEVGMKIPTNGKIDLDIWDGSLCE